MSYGNIKASAVASSHVETLVKTLFGPCTGTERTTGFTPLKDTNHNHNRKGYYKNNATSSASRVTPYTGSGCEEKLIGRMTPILEKHQPFVEQPRRVQFNASCKDDVILTLRKFDYDDDAISAITTLTLDEMENRMDREDAISGITSNTLEKMAQRYVDSKFKSSSAMPSCINPKWQGVQESVQHSTNPSSHKNLNKTSRPPATYSNQSESRQEEKIMKQAAESYETVIARLNYLKRSLEERQSRKQHRAKSILTREDMNQDQLNGLEFGEI